MENINTFFTMLIENSDNIETLPNITKILYRMPLKIFLVDMYTISRSLKTFKGGLPSQLSVIYLGGIHIQNIMYLLNDLYTSVQKYGKEIDTNNISFDYVKNIDKCAKKN
jgi:hypothetical protein